MAISLTNNKLASYIRESREELKKVTWPTRKAVIRDTLIVIGATLGLGLFFGLVDFGLSKGLQLVLPL